MNKLTKMFTPIIVAISLLSGCVTLKEPADLSGTESATVTIYRTDQMQGSFAATYVGWDGKYFAKLSKMEFVTLKVPVGLKEFNVKAHADITNELSISLSANEITCLMVEVNPDNIVGLNWFVPAYRLKQISCDDLILKDGFKQV